MQTYDTKQERCFNFHSKLHYKKLTIITKMINLSLGHFFIMHIIMYDIYLHKYTHIRIYVYICMYQFDTLDQREKTVDKSHTAHKLEYVI